METGKLVINIIFYTIVTAFFIYLLVKEKQLGAKIKIYRDKFSNFLINLFQIKKDSAKKILMKTVDLTEMIGSAIILVLIIQYVYIGNFLVPTGSMIPTIMPKERLFGNMMIYKFTKPKRGDIIVFKEPEQDKLLYTKRLIGLPGDKLRIGSDNRVYINGEKLTGSLYETSEKNVNFIKKRIEEAKSSGEMIGLRDEDARRYEEWSGGKMERVYYQPGNDGFSLEHDITIPKKGDTFSYDKNTTKFLLNNKDETVIIYDIFNDEKLQKKLINGEKIVLDENYYFGMGDNSGNSKDSRYWGVIAEHRISGQPFFRFWPLSRMGFIN